MTKELPYLWLQGKKPSTAEAQQIIALGYEALNQLDDKASEEEISFMFDMLTGNFKSSTAADEKATALGYLFALDGVSKWALKTAMKNVMKGKAKGLSTTFMPSGTELFFYCEKLEKGVRAQIGNIFRCLEKPEIKPKGRSVSVEEWNEFKRMDYGLGYDSDCSEKQSDKVA